MKIQPVLTRLILAALCGVATSAQAAIYVATQTGVGKYDSTTGAPINASLVSGLTSATHGIAVAGDRIYLSDATAGTVSVYDANTGALIDGSFLTGLSQPYRLTISGADLFVANDATGVIGRYTTAGATVSASLVTGLAHGAYPIGLDVNAGSLYVSTYDGVNDVNNVRSYTLGGSLTGGFQPTSFPITDVSASGSGLFISTWQGNFNAYTTAGSLIATGGFGANSYVGIEADGSNVLMAVYGFDPLLTIAKYDGTTGAVVDPLFIPGLPISGVTDFTIAAPVPEPATFAWGLVAIGALGLRRVRCRRAMDVQN